MLQYLRTEVVSVVCFFTATAADSEGVIPEAHFLFPHRLRGNANSDNRSAHFATLSKINKRISSFSISFQPLLHS